MKTLRHNYSLVLGDTGKKIIAPRYFLLNDNVYFVHISKDVEYVSIFIKLKSINENEIQVAPVYKLKLYTNSMGIYFNFGYMYDYDTHRIMKIYVEEF